MKTRAQMWGNSLAVRVPKAVAGQVGIGKDDELEIEAEKGNIVLVPSKRRTYDLDELVGKIDTENLHEEFEFGPPVGRESL